MAVRTREELFQRMNSLIRSGGQGGKTKAAEVRALITDLIDTMFSLFSNSGTSGGILQYHPTTLYDFENTPFCEFNYRIFKTKIDGQMGNEPPFSPNNNGDYENDYWVEVSPAPESGIAEWEPGVFTGSLVIVYYDNKLYRLDVPENEMPFESEDIVAEIGEGKWVVISGGGGVSGINYKLNFYNFETYSESFFEERTINSIKKDVNIDKVFYTKNSDAEVEVSFPFTSNISVDDGDSITWRITFEADKFQGTIQIKGV